MSPEIHDWIENPHPLKSKLPDQVTEWRRFGWTVDVVQENGTVYENIDPIIVFIGPSVVTHYRRAIASYQTEMPI